MKGRLFVVSGPSGCGKSTICQKIIEQNNNIKLSVSATTRLARKGETDSVHYYFITKEEFEKKIKEDAFYEYDFHFGNYYGSLKEKVDEQLNKGNHVILEIDVMGGMQIKEKNKQATLIFIMPPNEKELIRRLVQRNTESEEKLRERISRVKTEFSYKDKYDYVVVNDNLERTVKEVEGIILNGNFK